MQGTAALLVTCVCAATWMMHVWLSIGSTQMLYPSIHGMGAQRCIIATSKNWVTGKAAVHHQCIPSVSFIFGFTSCHHVYALPIWHLL